MQIKKTTFIIAFISAIFVSVSFMVAKAYEPLVRLPGLPLTGDINLSQYVVGLYNFLLSIVGIVAVMMLIIGGMKYITAAGNASIIGDAKDTISSAIFGLLLALLSWVIVSTINPDVLYIKDPASSLVGGYIVNHGACGEYDSVVCTCNDDTVPASPPVITNQDECNTACSENCGTTEPFPCVVNSNEPFIKDGVKMCSCIDGNKEVVLSDNATADTKCNEVCSDPSLAEDGKYHGVNWRLKIGNDVNGTMTVPEGENFTVEAGEPNYYDFSEVRDCKDNLIHFFIGFNGEPAVWSAALIDPHRWCCMEMAATCSSTWGECCNVGGCFSGTYHAVECSSLSEMNPIDGYPIFKHTYNTADTTETVWVGISVSTGGTDCVETEKSFMIDVQ